MDGKTSVLVLLALTLLTNVTMADYLWHNDEIPYDPSSKCYRGHSYYTNHDTPNQTDINYPEDVTSLLDFPTHNSCYFCVCSVAGDGVGCIPRHLWFCNYMRYLRGDNADRDMYANMFEQDRPSFFRQLSWRIRRTMDNSMFDLIEQVGDREAEQNHKDDKKCVPLVSEYTDCTPVNQCIGCTKCGCSPAGEWDCRSVQQCDVYHTDKIDDELFDAAVEKLDYELKKKSKYEGADKWKDVDKEFAPQTVGKKDESDELLEMLNNYNAKQKIKPNLRLKRSAKRNVNENKQRKRSAEKPAKKNKVPNNNNHTVKFYSTVDELDEDTLSHSNISGTLHAKRLQLNIPFNQSRRSNAENLNKSLQIDLNHPKVYNHITDNKIDSDHENKIDSHEKKLQVMLTNYTQKSKDKDLSKLVVNELKRGSEIIGDKHAPVTSNITFTTDNDTLTAMAFIAGNLLNKLWNMEKDATETAWETDDMKQEKISDLLDLFKEPLNMRQEAFLKNALQHLSSAIDKHKDIKNVSLCETIEEAKKFIHSNPDEDDSNDNIFNASSQHRKSENGDQKKHNQEATIKAMSKIKKVIGLIKKYEDVQKQLSHLKYGLDFQSNNTDNFTMPKLNNNLTKYNLTKEESHTFNMYGNILDKITKLLLPINKHKDMASGLKQKKLLGSDKYFKSHFKKMFGIDIENMTVTAKDKLVLDYIEHINSNPDCLIGKKDQRLSLPVIEGNILLNLSEVFKMKSFADLVNMLHPEKKSEEKNNDFILNANNNKPIKSTTVTSVTEKNLKLSSTKERLKSHLKSIIEDLIELQNAKGIKSRGSVKIADALPCIYNIMNAGKEMISKNNGNNNGPGGIVSIFNGLKHDMKIAKTRRSDSIMSVRPKSAVVLERVLQRFVDKSGLKSRRFLEVSVKPIDELKYIINKISNVSSIYKDQALFSEVPAADKLMLLKTLAEDVKNYIVALEKIKEAFQNGSQLSTAEFNELATFVVNSMKNISLNAKVIKKLETAKTRKQPVVQETFNRENINQEIIKRLPVLENRPHSILSGGLDNGDDMVITRKQIIGHLIRNRMKMFMKWKEAQTFNTDGDLHYNIAKKVLFYLDSGNFDLAQELFKTLIMQKHVDGFDNTATNEHSEHFNLPNLKMEDIAIRQDDIAHIKPLIEFEESKPAGDQIKWMNQDHMIKQLLNIKNMGL